MTDFRPLAAAYENGQDSNKITLCAITVVLFRKEENCLFTTCELRTFELTWTKPLKCYFLGIGEIHKMSHNMVLNHEDFTAPIEPLKLTCLAEAIPMEKKSRQGMMVSSVTSRLSSPFLRICTDDVHLLVC